MVYRIVFCELKCTYQILQPDGKRISSTCVFYAAPMHGSCVAVSIWSRSLVRDLRNGSACPVAMALLNSVVVTCYGLAFRAIDSQQVPSALRVNMECSRSVLELRKRQRATGAGRR